MQPLASITHHGADAPPPPPQPAVGAAGSHAGMPWLHSDRPQQQLLQTTATDLPRCGGVGVDGKNSQQLHHGAIAPPASAAGGRNTAAGPPLAPDAPGQQSTRSALGVMNTVTVAPSSIATTTGTRPGYASLNILNIRLSEEPAAGADDSLPSAGSRQAVPFMASIALNDPRVRRLDAMAVNGVLQFNGIAIEDMIEPHAVLLASLHCTVTRICLHTNRKGDAGLAWLSEGLKRNASVVDLEIRWPKLASTGLAALSEALKVNRTLAALNLAMNGIEEKGASALSEAIKVNSTLVTLDLEANAIGDHGAAALSQALKVNSSLATLSLNSNRIRSAGGILLSEALQANAALASLDLSSNKLDDAALVAVLEAAQGQSYA